MTLSEACEMVVSQVRATAAARADAESWRQLTLGCLRFMRQQSKRVAQLERSNALYRQELEPIWAARREGRAA